MALSGSIINQDGSPSTYFVIRCISIWPQSEAVAVTVDGYYNENTYMSPCTANYTFDTSFTFTQVGATTDITQAEVYAFLQTLPQFSGSVIVN